MAALTQLSPMSGVGRVPHAIIFTWRLWGQDPPYDPDRRSYQSAVGTGGVTKRERCTYKIREEE